jgi:hypothetical protein
LNEIEAEINPSLIKSAMYFFMTVFEKLYDNIMFNQDGLDKVASHINDPYCNVVLLPTH